MYNVLTEAVKLSLLLPLMILQNALTKVANVMYFYWTSAISINQACAGHMPDLKTG